MGCWWFIYTIFEQVTNYKGDDTKILNNYVICNDNYSNDLRISGGLV